MARTLLGGLEHATCISFVFAARLLLVFASIPLPCCWSVHKSLAPRSRTLLGVLGQATLNFVAVATLLFFFFCVCPKFCNLAKQRRKIYVGVSEVGKFDFSLYFFWLCVFLYIVEAAMKNFHCILCYCFLLNTSVLPCGHTICTDCAGRTSLRPVRSTFLKKIIVISRFLNQEIPTHKKAARRSGSLLIPDILIYKSQPAAPQY